MLTQMRKGALEYCVLALLAGQRCTGSSSVRTLAEVDGMVLSEGTLYPLLSRLRKDDSSTPPGRSPTRARLGGTTG